MPAPLLACTRLGFFLPSSRRCGTPGLFCLFSLFICASRAYSFAMQRLGALRDSGLHPGARCLRSRPAAVFCNACAGPLPSSLNLPPHHCGTLHGGNCWMLCSCQVTPFGISLPWACPLPLHGAQASACKQRSRPAMHATPARQLLRCLADAPCSWLAVG